MTKLYSNNVGVYQLKYISEPHRKMFSFIETFLNTFAYVLENNKIYYFSDSITLWVMLIEVVKVTKNLVSFFWVIFYTHLFLIIANC